LPRPRGVVPGRRDADPRWFVGLGDRRGWVGDGPPLAFGVVRHVVWDWNGTLLDDLAVVVEAVNASIARYDAGPIDADGYRDRYQRPVKHFYDSLLGRDVGDDEWRAIDTYFHQRYRDGLDRVDLTADAVAALEAVRDVGATQSLLSMWWHEELVLAVDRHGLTSFFSRVDGNDHDAGASKADHLRRHVGSLGLPGRDVVAIGDSLDDALAARAVGVSCVMYDGGSHHRRELEASGLPVAGSLVAAVELALA
jgi:phosphoglycolate phosphatase-like HAD superfamily hydrolase